VVGCCEHGDETSSCINVEKFLTGWETVSFLRIVLDGSSLVS